VTAASAAPEQSFRFSNPVLARELRQRMSTPRIVIVLTAYLAILGGALVLLYRARANSTSQFRSVPGISEFADIGQSLFEFVLFFMVLLVLFVVPGFTAASIAGERERQTLRALQVTMLSPFGIVSGKVAASIALTVLLLIVSMPLLAIAFLIGGITFSEVFISLGMLLFSAAALACITVACSALVKRVPGAILLAYGVVIALVSSWPPIPWQPLPTYRTDRLRAQKPKSCSDRLDHNRRTYRTCPRRLLRFVTSSTNSRGSASRMGLASRMASAAFRFQSIRSATRFGSTRPPMARSAGRTKVDCRSRPNSCWSSAPLHWSDCSSPRAGSRHRRARIGRTR